MTEPSTLNFQNYFRLNVLVTTWGCGILRQHFRQRYRLLTKREWIDGSEESKAFLLKQMNGNLKHFPKIQKGMLETGDLGKWDITLLSSLLTKVNFGVNVTEEVSEKFRKENKCILHLTEIRNKLAHLPDKVLSGNEFIKFWVAAEKVLVFLGVPGQDVENIRTGSGLVGIELTDGMIFKENNILAASLCTEGVEALKFNDFEKGINCFDKALTLQGLSHPVRGILHSNRSLACMRFIIAKEHSSDDEFDLLQLALEDARAAIHLQSTWWIGYVRAARVYQFQKQMPAVNILMRRALSLNPSVEATDERNDVYHYVNPSGFTEEGSPKSEDTVEIALPEMSNESKEETRSEPTNAGEITEVMENSSPEVNQLSTKPDELDTGSAEQVSLARCYLEDNAVPIDPKVAADFVAEVTYIIGLMHLSGLGVPKDINVAIEMLEKAAELPKKQNTERNIGVAEAKFLLGKCYEEGIGKSQDIAKAIFWYSRASKEGLNEATNKLAQLYSNGVMVIQDIGKAISYWSVAAGRGDASAMSSLAFEYLNREKLDKAESWFQHFLKTGKATESDIKKFKRAANAQLKAKSRRETSSCLVSQPKVDQKDTDNSLGKEPTMKSVPMETTLFGRCFDFESQITLKAESLSNLYTQKLLSSMEAYVSGMDVLGTWIERENQMIKAERKATRNKLFEYLSSCFRQITLMTVELPPQFRKQIEKITDGVIYSTAQHRSDHDKIARVIRSKILNTSGDQCVDFLKLSIEKYPTEEYFYEMLSSTLLRLERNEEGEKTTKAAIESFPLNYDLHFLHAEHIRCGIEGQKFNKSKTCIRHAVTAYQNFLKMAPLDHPKYPVAYYGLAVVLFWLEKASEGETYFKRGLEKEMDLIPCFALQNCSSKSICLSVYPQILSSGSVVDSSTNIFNLASCSSKVDDTSDYYTQETENKSDEEESDCRSEYPKDSTDTADSEETESVSSENDPDHIVTVDSNQNPQTSQSEEPPCTKPEKSSWMDRGVIILASTLLISLWLSRSRN